jgi:excisionase family DNA binding protein
MNNMAPSGQKWLNAREAAKYAGIGSTTLYAWIREGKLPFPHYPLAPKIMKFKQADIDKWLESRKEGPGTGPIYPRKHK